MTPKSDQDNNVLGSRVGPGHQSQVLYKIMRRRLSSKDKIEAAQNPKGHFTFIWNVWMAPFERKSVRTTALLSERPHPSYLLPYASSAGAEPFGIVDFSSSQDLHAQIQAASSTGWVCKHKGLAFNYAPDFGPRLFVECH